VLLLGTLKWDNRRADVKTGEGLWREEVPRTRAKGELGFMAYFIIRLNIQLDFLSGQGTNSSNPEHQHSECPHS
jgi:hypothetical protein